MKKNTYSKVTRGVVVVLTTLVAVFTLCTIPVFSQTEDLSNPVIEQTGLARGSFTSTIARVINIFLGFLGLIALVLIIYAGVVWMTSGGNQDKISQAKKIMINAAIGLAIILGAAVIANFIFWLIGRATDKDIGTNPDNPPVTCIGTDCFLGPPGSAFKLTSHSPADNEINVKACRAVQGVFNSTVDEASLISAFSLTQEGSETVVTASSGGALSVNENAFRFYLADSGTRKDFLLNTSYTAKVSTDARASADAKKLAGVRMSTPKQWRFTTAASEDADDQLPQVNHTEGPRIFDVSPKPGTGNVCLTPPIQAVFTEEIDVTTLKKSHIVLIDRATGGDVPLTSVTIGSDLKSFTVQPAQPLAKPETGTHEYEMRLYTKNDTTKREGILDVCGNPLNGKQDDPIGNQPADFVWQFSTGVQSTKDCAPEISSISPAMARYGQAVTISGARFGAQGEVTFNTTVADSACSVLTAPYLLTTPCVQRWTETDIQIKVPLAATTGKISIALGENFETTSKEQIDILSPYLHDANPNPVRKKELLRLVGKNFGPTRGAVEFIKAGIVVKTITDAPDVCKNTPETWNDHSLTVFIPDDLAVGEYRVRVKTSGIVSELSNRISLVVENGAPRPGLCSVTPNEGPVGTATIAEGIHLNRISHLILVPDKRVSRAEFSSASDTNIGFVIPVDTQTGYVTPHIGDEAGTPSWFRVFSGRLSQWPGGPGGGGPGTGPGTVDPNDPKNLPKNPRLIRVHPTGPSPANCSIVLEFDRAMNVESVVSHTTVEFRGSALSKTGTSIASGKKVGVFPQTENKQWPIGSGTITISGVDAKDTQGNALDCVNSPVKECRSSFEFINKIDLLKRLDVTPNTAKLQIGGSAVQVTAVPVGTICDQGIVATPSWDALNPSVARIDTQVDALNVRVAPVGLGETQILASSQDKRAFSIVEVFLRNGPPFYMVQAGPQGENRYTDEVVTLNFNAPLNSATVTPATVKLTKQGEQTNLSMNPDGSSAIEFVDSAKIRIRRLANKGTASEAPINFDLNTSYIVDVDEGLLKTTTAPQAVLDCSRAQGVDTVQCSYQFRVIRGPAPVAGIVFDRDLYSIRVGTTQDAVITVFAQQEGETPYATSHTANFSLVSGIEYIVPDPNPHQPSQRFRIRALSASHISPLPEARMQAAIDTIEVQAPADAVIQSGGGGCTGPECSDIDDPRRQIRIVSIVPDGLNNGSTCRTTITITLDKYIHREVFPLAHIKVFEKVNGNEISRPVTITDATQGITKVIQLSVGSLIQPVTENSSLRIEVEGPLAHALFIDQTSAQMLVDISRRLGDGETTPLCTGGTNCPREDVNRDGKIDINDLSAATATAQGVEYSIVCNKGVCDFSYEYNSVQACGNGEGADAGPPTIVEVAPAVNTTNVCTNGVVQAVFDKGIASVSGIDSLVTITPAVPGRIVTVDGRLLQIRPKAGEVLSASTSYSVALTPGAWGRKGEPLNCGFVPKNGAGACTWSFTTGAVACRATRIEVKPREVAGMTVDSDSEVHIHESMQALFSGIPFSSTGQPLSSPVIARWKVADPSARLGEQSGQHAGVIANRTTRSAQNKIIAELTEPETKAKIEGEYPFTVETCKQHFVMKDTEAAYNEINTNYLLTDDGPADRVRSPHAGVKTHFSTFACIDDLDDSAWPARVSVKTAIVDRPRFSNIHYVQVPNLNKPEEPDAIIIVTGKNSDRLSLDEWVRSASLPIASEQGKIVENMTIGGYPAARAGTSVYVRSADYDGNSRAFTMVTVLSYNEGAQSRTVQLFNALVNSMTFNTNLASQTTRERFKRDALRVMDITDILRALENTPGGHPSIPAGSFEANHTTSRWNSWNTEFGRKIGIKMPVDPLNTFDCPSGYDSATCWSKEKPISARFVCPLGSYVYQYRFIDTDRFDIKAHFEFERVTWEGVDDAPPFGIPTPAPLSGGENENRCVNFVISP